MSRPVAPSSAAASLTTIKIVHNCDIYLPEWLARHNKTVLGVLYVAGALFTLVRWVRT